jgi:hypothetical protein
VTNKPNFDFSPAESRQRPAPSLASADAGPHLVLLGVTQHELQLIEVLDHGNDRAPELRRENHGFDVAVIFEAVADDHAIRCILRQRHHGQEFRLGACFQPEAEFLSVPIHFLDHEPLLVNLDWKHGHVAILVIVFSYRL